MAEIAPRSLRRDVTRKQELTESLQGSERRAQLVGRDGEELILGLIQLAQASGRPRYLLLELLGEVALALREARVPVGRSPSRSMIRAPTGPCPASSPNTSRRHGVAPALGTCSAGR